VSEIIIRTATSRADFEAFAGLLAEYVQWCRDRYRDDPWFVDRIFGHQSLDDELRSLSTTYAAPNGRTLMAVSDGVVCGTVAFRRLDDGSCEMKRLTVSDRFKGRGIGRRLCEAVISAARDEGFALMRLDTLSLMKEAQSMYESHGFRRCAPHHEYPAELMPYLVFMELPLRDA
jgi:ribosomal protein S18 acetylase RimI-like enzyme